MRLGLDWMTIPGYGLSLLIYYIVTSKSQTTKYWVLCGDGRAGIISNLLYKSSVLVMAKAGDLWPIFCCLICVFNLTCGLYNQLIFILLLWCNLVYYSILFIAEILSHSVLFQIFTNWKRCTLLKTKMVII